MNILDIALKDLTRSQRNLFLIGMTLVAPMVLTLLIYFAFGGLVRGESTIAPVTVGVVNLDRLPPGAPLEASLGESLRSLFFDESVQSWIIARDYADEAAARLALNTQEIGVAVIIPAVFTEQYLAGNRQAPILILQDPTLTIGPSIVRDMVNSLMGGVTSGGVAYRVVEARLQASGKTLDPATISEIMQRLAEWYSAFQHALYHTPEQSALLVTSSSLSAEASQGYKMQTMMGLVMAGQIIFFAFFTAAYAMESILQEEEEGTLAHLFFTPVSRNSILAGKYLYVFLVVLVQGLVLILLGRLLFNITWGSPGTIALALFGQICGAVGLAVLLVSLIKTTRQAGPIFGGGLTALGMLGGLFTTNIDMPAAYNAIGNFTPQGWVLKAWKLSLAGQPPAELVLPTLVLTALGVVMFLIGAYLFRRRFT